MIQETLQNSNHTAEFKSIFKYDTVVFSTNEKQDETGIKSGKKNLWGKIYQTFQSVQHQAKINSHAIKTEPIQVDLPGEELKIEANVSLKENLSSKIQNEFREWSLLTKFDGYSKIFEYKKLYSKIYWTSAHTDICFGSWLRLTDLY